MPESLVRLARVDPDFDPFVMMQMVDAGRKFYPAGPAWSVLLYLDVMEWLATERDRARSPERLV